MIIEVKVPSPGESITQVQLASWLVSNGDLVQKDAEIAEIDSDKATLSITAEAEGKIRLLQEEGASLAIGTVIATIDTTDILVAREEASPVKQEEVMAPAGKEEPAYHVSPLAKKMMDERQISHQDIAERFGSIRISRKELDQLSQTVPAKSPAIPLTGWGKTNRDTERKKMSTLRLKLSERLVAVKNQTAMLTTFNEVDMTAITQIRNQYKEAFKQKFGVSLGFMSFFTKAVTEALRLYPAVNAMIDGEDIVYHQYADIGIAVSAPKGLMVPVLRNTEGMSLAEIEQTIKDLAEKARTGKLSIEEMSGGTFTITNGGVFGSLMSTPIINPPQSAILGMHKIMDRPVAVNGSVEIHPMMYVALSYDHRIIDGRESVGFLVKVKEMLEEPVRLMFTGDDPMKVLLNL